MEHALFLIKMNQLMQVAKSGIGIIKSVMNALLDGFSQMVHVFQLIIYVKSGMDKVYALNAIKDIYFKKENVTIGILISHKIWDVEIGTGIAKFVWNAQLDGFTEKKKDVFQLTHYVKNGMKMETVLPVIKDTI